MKTNFKFISNTIIMLVILNSCQNEGLETVSQTELDNSALSKTYNNGMIKGYDTSVLLKWNEAISLAIDTKLPPPAEARIYAMVSLAMHDALNNLVPKYETYALDNNLVNAKDVSKNNISQLADAAISQSAFEVLTKLYPPSQIAATTLLNSCLSEIEDSEFKEKGIEVGKAAALAILSKRAGDNSELPRFVTYNGDTYPGAYQVNYMPWLNPNPPVWPEKAAYGEFFGDFTPFGIKTGDQFRAEPPYAINSLEYTNDYNEVKKMGCSNCPDRTPEQTEIGKFWIENISSAMNRIVRTLAEQENLNGWETARLLALTHMVQVDANISSFEGKFFYKFWRPISAIKAGEADGNNLTIGDPTWLIMSGIRPTPPNPEYPSTHAECAAAAAELLKLFFKTDYKSFTATNPYDLPGVERSITTFSQIAEESAVSRIYIGYHFRHSIEQGLIQGRKLGSYVYENNLEELK